MEQLQFKLTKYEGPLGLLLELIRAHKLNIHDIEISILLEQYIEYIADMHALNLEVASEFLAMAAHLIYIKTLSLLPKPEESEKLKRELQGQLLEYQWCQIIASQMKDMYKGSNIFVRKPLELEFSKEDSYYQRFHNPLELIEAYMISLGRAKRNEPPSRTAFNKIVSQKKVDIKVGKLSVLQKLLKEGRVLYEEFFYSEEWSEQIAVFLAMLDLLKGNRIVVSEDGKYIEFNKDYNRDEIKDISTEELDQMFSEDSGFDTPSTNIDDYETQEEFNSFESDDLEENLSSDEV